MPNILKANWKSGLTVALISVPLSIALSIASGAGPIAGIVTGIWATLIASFFASSNYNIIGPAGALVTVLFAATVEAPAGLGAAVLPLLALGSGIALLAIWALKADRFLYYVPSSVIYGFSAGVAFLIAASQLFDATGLSTLKRTGTFEGDIALFIEHIAEVNYDAVLLCAIFVAGILIWKRCVKTLPAVIPAAVLGIVVGITQDWFGFHMLTLGDKFGEVVGALFLPVSWSGITSIVASSEGLIWFIKLSLVIALISVLETLITAKIGDKLTKTQSSGRKEIFGLALANLGSGVMGGLPATGVFLRTGANIKAGATHRTSAALSAVFTAIIALIVMPLFVFIPVAVIAAILINTALGLIETERFKEFWHHEKSSFIIGCIVALITILHDPGLAVLAGATMALLIFADRVSVGHFHAVFNYPHKAPDEARGKDAIALPDLTSNKTPDIITYSLAGMVSYIDAGKHAANLRTIARTPGVKTVILRMRNLFSLDMEAKEMLAEAVDDLTKSGKTVHVSSADEGIKTQICSFDEIRSLAECGQFHDKTERAVGVIRAKGY